MTDDHRVVRVCRCGCGRDFIASNTSKRIYFSRRHKELAHAYRRKLKDAGVVVTASN
jgi:hypothetical protein